MRYDYIIHLPKKYILNQITRMESEMSVPKIRYEPANLHGGTRYDMISSKGSISNYPDRLIHEMRKDVLYVNNWTRNKPSYQFVHDGQIYCMKVINGRIFSTVLEIKDMGNEGISIIDAITVYNELSDL